jgi:hypothetical protein
MSISPNIRIANIRLMFQLIVTRFHSPLTFSSPLGNHDQDAALRVQAKLLECATLLR